MIYQANDSPAAARKAITVASSDITDSLSPFSNFGDVIDIIAPGSYINSGYLIDNIIFRIYCLACSLNTHGCTSESIYIPLSGTSMATPVNMPI